RPDLRRRRCALLLRRGAQRLALRHDRILDEAFNGIEEPVKQKLMDRIYAHGAWTLITVTDDDPETVERADHVIVLDRGSVVWSGRPRALAHEPDAFLCEHFPQLVASLRTSQPTSA
ncbi:MAG: hypothetical protein AAFR95_04080, partial [Bacteroidota bacterium]